MTAPRLFHAIQRAHTALFRAADRVLAADGIGASQLGVLFVLAERGPTSAGALARTLGLGKPAISGLVHRMAMAGLVARRPRKGDRRGVDVVITANGRQLARRHAETTRRLNAALLDGFDTAERAVIVRFLTHVATCADTLAALISTAKETP
jgi:DNA-binding MarR family transcriptional regulator